MIFAPTPPGAPRHPSREGTATAAPADRDPRSSVDPESATHAPANGDPRSSGGSRIATRAPADGDPISRGVPRIAIHAPDDWDPLLRGVPAGRGVLLRIALGLSLACAPLAAAPATVSNGWLVQSFTGAGVKGTIAIPGDSVPRFGFVPVRVTIDNAQQRDLRWEAGFELNSYNNFGLSSGAGSSTTMIVPAARATERWIFVPTPDAGLTRNGYGYYGGWAGMNVTVNGTGLGDTRMQFYGSGGSRPNPMVPWGVSASLETAVRTRIAALRTAPGTAAPRRYRVPALSGPQPVVNGPANLVAFDPAQALGDWRVWSPFARVILRADEFAFLPPANRGALRNWVALGGTLYLSPAQPRPADRQNFGAGQIVTLAQPIESGTGDDAELFNPAALFNTTPAIPNSGDLSLEKGGLAEKVPPAKRVGDWLVYFFLGFAVIVAPVNLYAIAPVRRRHWLFLSLPAISLAAVALLTGAIYLQDGVGGHGARRALVVLLPGDNQAAVFQDQISRTGLLFKGDFALPDDTLCATIAADDSNIQPGRALEYNRQNGRALGDWFRGRARQAQHLRRLVPTRARVEQVGQAPDGAPIVQSSVGATLRKFYYVDRGGGSWSAELIPAGTRVTLQRLSGNSDYGRAATEFGAVGSIHFNQLVQSCVMNPTPDRFVALADDSDLAPIPTLTTIGWDDSTVMISGVVANVSGPANAAKGASP
jgi:hypothetical protein